MGSGHIEADKDHLVKVMADALDMVATSMERGNPRGVLGATTGRRMSQWHICHAYALIDLAQARYEDWKISAEGVRNIRTDMLRAFGVEST